MTLDTGSLLIFIFIFICAYLHSTKRSGWPTTASLSSNTSLSSLVDQVFDVVCPIHQWSYYSSTGMYGSYRPVYTV